MENYLTAFYDEEATSCSARAKTWNVLADEATSGDRKEVYRKRAQDWTDMAIAARQVAIAASGLK